MYSTTHNVGALCSKCSRTLTFENACAHVARFAASYGSCQPPHYRRRPPHCTVCYFFSPFNFFFFFLSSFFNFSSNESCQPPYHRRRPPTVLFSRLPFFTLFLFTIISAAPWTLSTAALPQHTHPFGNLPPPPPPPHLPVPLKCVLCVCVFSFLWCVSHNRSSCIYTFQTASHRARTSRTSICRHKFSKVLYVVSFVWGIY